MTHRETIHPISDKHARQVAQIHSIRRHWANGNGHIGDSPELALAVGLIVTLAPSKPVLLNLLATLTPKHWDDTRGTLSIPADQPDTHERSLEATYELEVPPSLRPPIRRFLRKWPDIKKEPFMRPQALSAAEYIEWATRRRERLSQTLNRQWRAWSRNLGFKRSGMTVAVMCRSAAPALVTRGMPAQIAFMLQSAPLPTTSTTPFLRDDPDRPSAPVMNRASVQTRSAGIGIGGIERTPPAMADDAYAERDPWRVDAVIRCLRQTRERLIAANDARALAEALEQGQSRLWEIEQLRGTFVELLMLWVAHMASARQGPKPSSIRTYTNRLLRPGLLAAPIALSVTDWDTDDVTDVIDLVSTDQSHWAPATFGHFLQTLAFFISFLQKLGFAEQASVPGAGRLSKASTYRQAVLGPHHVDAVIEQVLADARDEADDTARLVHEQVAAVLILAYYAGMRSGEIETLTLAHFIRQRHETVAFEPGLLSQLLGKERKWVGEPDRDASAQSEGLQLYVNILAGKTPAARRRVALHALAPERWVDWLEAFVARRGEHSRRQRFERIPLLIHRNRDDSGADVLALARDYIRGFYGSQRDLHSLRHGGASLHFLRISALRTIEPVERLIDSDHRVFSDVMQNKLRREIEWPQGAAIWERGLAEHWLSRTLGHSQLSTTIKTYTHTISLIHSEWLRRC